MSVSLITAPKNLLCKHCGKELGSFPQTSFCCAGCASVYSILQASGLSHFYDLKKDGVCFVGPAPALTQESDFLFWNELSKTLSEPELYIEGIHCSACVWLLEQLPVALSNTVETCRLDLGKSILTLTLRPNAQLSEVGTQISKWGYRPHLIENEIRAKNLQKKENQKRLTELGIAGALAGNIMLMSIPLYAGITGEFELLFEWISAILAIPALFISGRSFFENVKSGIKNKTFPIDLPILLALVIAFTFSWFSLIQHTHKLYFDSLSALIFLLLSSRYYLARLRQSSALSLGTLDFFKAKFDGTVGSFVSLKPNEEVPFDGIIRSGELWVDRSKFTGESMPVQLKVGEWVLAGSRVNSASLSHQIEVIKIGETTRLAELLKKVEQSQRARTAIEIVSDQLAKKLLAVVITVGVLSFGFFIGTGLGLSEAITRLLALLIVTCPCALALATPLVFSLAMKTLLRKGVLVKDPNSLDAVLTQSKIYFDKTGTLTKGALTLLTNLDHLSPHAKSILLSMSVKSQHPVSRAIQQYFSQSYLAVPLIQFEQFEEKIGLGLFAGTESNTFRLIRAPIPYSKHTEVCLFNGESEIARIELSDELQPDSKKTINQLKSFGFDIAILSGDHQAPAKEIADELGIKDVHAELSPEQKAEFAKNGIMVGDGFNDALSLSAAKVSIAVQGGMEAAIRTSQVYTLKPGIGGLLDFVQIAKAVRSTLKINFILSTSYNIVGAILSLSGYMNPLIAAVLMPLSALSVFTFSMWRFKRL